MSETARQARREWHATKLGKLLQVFEACLGAAWVTDQRERATAASMERDWGRANKAREALLGSILGLQEHNRDLLATLAALIAEIEAGAISQGTINRANALIAAAAAAAEEGTRQ